MGAAVRAGRAFAGVVRNYRKDGTPFWNEVTIRPVRTNGHVERFVGTVDDVTKITELDAAKRQADMDVVAAKARTEAERNITAYIFHEFRMQTKL